MPGERPTFEFDNSYARELDGFYVAWKGETAPDPKLVLLNRDLAHELRLDPDDLETGAAAAILAGSVAPSGATPLAQAYAGHQFGGFSPQLGDGRALLIGEVIDRKGQRRDIHLKGSGRTPFSRGGDGKAVLGPVLREYLMGEAMHALGIPTTRALAAVTTGEEIFRDGPKPGAVLTRVAASHLRVGTFQFFAARDQTDKVRQLADYAIARHDPDLQDDPDRYHTFLLRVAERQASLIARWMQTGFVHGVMNTDNMAISGETIDFGPCAFIDAYDPRTVYSSIDQGGRYAFGNQPGIAQWNLARFAETLLPLLDDDPSRAIDRANVALEHFAETYQNHWLTGFGAKIGLSEATEDDHALITDLLDLLEKAGADFTGFFRALATAAEGDHGPVRALVADAQALDGWLGRWRARLDGSEPAAAMNRVNPVYIPRNHKVEEALSAAEEHGDIAPLTRLLTVLRDPFTQAPAAGEYELPAPADFGPYRTFCGT